MSEYERIKSSFIVVKKIVKRCVIKFYKLTSTIL